MTRHASLPGMVWLVLACAFVPWLAGDIQVLTFNVTGWAWVIPLLASSFVCVNGFSRIVFPLRVWLPWAAILGLSLVLSGDHDAKFQTFFQMLTPLVVGCAVSTVRFTDRQVAALIRIFDKAAWLIGLLVFIKVPGLMGGRLLEHSYMAAEVIGTLLFGAFYAAQFVAGSPRHLVYYGAMCLVPLLCLTRGPMLAAGIGVLITPVPLKARWRILLAVLLVIVAVAAFNSERIQRRIFFSGEGTVADIRLDNRDLATSGRSVMWELLWDRVPEAPWMGHGLNASRTVLTNAGCVLYLPHNDWLKILHDFGLVGVTAFALAMAAQVHLLTQIARRNQGPLRALAYGAAACFAPFVLIMLTDNPILYVQFYGDVHFMLIGVMYGALAAQRQIGNEGRESK